MARLKAEIWGTKIKGGKRKNKRCSASWRALVNRKLPRRSRLPALFTSVRHITAESATHVSPPKIMNRIWSGGSTRYEKDMHTGRWRGWWGLNKETTLASSEKKKRRGKSKKAKVSEDGVSEYLGCLLQRKSVHTTKNRLKIKKWHNRQKTKKKPKQEKERKKKGGIVFWKGGGMAKKKKKHL